MALRVIAASALDQPTTYRVGVVAYDDIQDRASTLQKYFLSLGDDVKFASGTAEEVLDWISEGAVDIAILSPGAFAATGALLTKEERQKNPPTWDCRYLITHSLLPSESPFALPERTKSRKLFFYQPLCLISKRSAEALKITPEQSVETTVEIIKKAAQDGGIQFVFGDPLSLSGTIFPRAQLEDIGADFERHSELSFGLSDTLDLLLDEPEIAVGEKTRHRIGFVFDGTIPHPRPSGSDMARTEEMKSKLMLLHLPFPLEPPGITQPISGLPTEVWVVRPDFGKKATDELRKKLQDLPPPENYSESLFKDQRPDGEINALVARVQKWASDGCVQIGGKGEKRPSLFREILDSMRHYQKLTKRAPKLALVLSGGGAKCAYQAGAIASIERQIGEMKDFKILAPNADPGRADSFIAPDISLVVGTSGGALNALPTAIGLTATDPNKLASMWDSINLIDFFRPYPVVSGLFGVLTASILLFATWLVGGPFVRWGNVARSSNKRRARYAAFLIEVLMQATAILRLALILALAAFWTARYFRPERVAEIGPGNRVLHYLLWLPLNFSVGWGAVILSVVTAFCIAWGLWRRHTEIGQKWQPTSPETKWWRGVAIIFVTASVLAYVALWTNNSLSDGTAMKDLVVNQFERLLGSKAPKYNYRTGRSVQSSRLSAAICGDEQITRRRDLVISVSVLGKPGASDLYLHLPATSAQGASEYGRAHEIGNARKVNFIEDRTQILNAITASGTIFPIFPSYLFADPQREHDMFVVDGGFAHNIPVEAAVDWGATHIIVIEASPEIDRTERQSFIENLSVAFDHLFAQAQLTDVRSRQTAEIYTLRPEKEILKTLNFAPALTRKAVEAGMRDADGGLFRQYSKAPKLTKLPSVESAPTNHVHSGPLNTAKTMLCTQRTDGFDFEPTN